MRVLATAARGLRPVPLRPRARGVAALEGPSAASFAFAFAVVGAWRGYEQRSRGWLEAGVPLQIGPSCVPGGGRGVYAAADVSARTSLGAYPGRLLPYDAYHAKCARAPNTGNYCWMLAEGVLDPTGDDGVLLEPLPLLGTLPIGSIPTTLSLINEPPPGCDVNIMTEERGDGVLLFSTARDVAAGEELYLDYGVNYDRSHYSF